MTAGRATLVLDETGGGYTLDLQVGQSLIGTFGCTAVGIFRGIEVRFVWPIPPGQVDFPFG